MCTGSVNWSSSLSKKPAWRLRKRLVGGDFISLLLYLLGKYRVIISQDVEWENKEICTKYLKSVITIDSKHTEVGISAPSTVVMVLASLIMPIITGTLVILAWSKKNSNLYFERYCNEEVTFFDEFNGAKLPFDVFKEWCQPGADQRKKTCNYFCEQPKPKHARSSPCRHCQSLFSLVLWLGCAASPCVSTARIVSDILSRLPPRLIDYGKAPILPLSRLLFVCSQHRMRFFVQDQPLKNAA